MALLEKIFGVKELRVGETVKYLAPTNGRVVKGTGTAERVLLLGLGVQIDPIKPPVGELPAEIVDDDGRVRVTRGNVIRMRR